MSEVDAKLVPYLFMVLFGLILVNLIINVCLYFFSSKTKNIKMLAWYWGSLLLTYLAQGGFQEGEMGIMLSFGLNVIPLFIIAKILLDSLNREFPLKRNVGIFVFAIVLSGTLKSLGFPFEISAMPLCLALSQIIFVPGLMALYIDRKTTSLNQKFTGFMYIFGGIHLINFALFRMHPGAQIWGWSLAFGQYQALSITLYANALEEYFKGEKARLEKLVALRTEELSNTLKLKDNLFKVVLHDIANPIQGQVWILEKYQRSQQIIPMDMSKLNRLTNLIKEVIQQVRSIELVKTGELNLNLTPVNFQKCIDDMFLIFEGALNQKDITLVINDELPPETYFMADQNAFTTSVLCNLVSNAIKFSPTHKELHIRAFLKDQKIVIEVEDQGIGMPKEMTFRVFDPNKKFTRPGTLGERGTGYGLPLAKSFMDYFGGNIEVESKPMDIDPIAHGTKFTMTLDQTLSH